MRLPDVNVLVAALRPDSDHHDRCRSWLEQVVDDPRPFALTGMVLAGVVRILTHPRVFRPPSRTEDVLDRVMSLVAVPTAVRVEPGPRHLGLFAALVRDARATGNLTTDAWLAAIALEHGCTFVTLDGDFHRFPQLDVVEP